jgi:sugar-phosphatase
MSANLRTEMSADMSNITLSVSALLLDMDGTLVCSTGDVE